MGRVTEPTGRHLFFSSFIWSEKGRGRGRGGSCCVPCLWHRLCIRHYAWRWQERDSWMRGAIDGSVDQEYMELCLVHVDE